jgi:uncharacterized protein
MYLDNYSNKIKGLCDKYNVRHLFAFGSVVTDKFSNKSDIDLLVDINSTDPIDYAENYFELKFELEKLLNRQIDLLEERALQNPFLIKSIDNSKMKIYGD